MKEVILFMLVLISTLILLLGIMSIGVWLITTGLGIPFMFRYVIAVFGVYILTIPLRVGVRYGE